ncbi:hypothetical protein RCC89_10675 [Cytophagaceae bacterium ABcell3]|nr:hypothetical protein RCC89_10675 [Cytophagaceae bacterium ABcell3]
MKIAILAVLIMLVVGIAGEILSLTGIYNVQEVTRNILGVGRLAAIGLLLYYGSLRSRTVFYSLMIVSAGIFVLGNLLEIMHWPGADVFITTGLAGLPLVYSVHYLSKEVKQLLDHLKVLWVWLFVVPVFLRVFHVSYPTFMLFAEWGVFLLLFSLFAFKMLMYSKS